MMRPKSETIPVRLPRSSVVCATALAAALIGVGTPARAVFVTYTNTTLNPLSPADSLTLSNSQAAEMSFVSALKGVGFEKFDSQPQGVGNFPTSLTFSSTAVTATGMDADATDNYVTNAAHGGAHAISGSQYLLSNGSSTGLNATLSFSTTPVAGIGFYVTDLANGGGMDQLKLVLTLTNTATPVTFLTPTQYDQNDGDGNVLFFGVVSTDPMYKIMSVQITNTTTGSGDVFGIDDLAIGTSAAVPEPASVVLLGIGVLGLAVGRARRGRSSSRPA